MHIECKSIHITGKFSQRWFECELKVDWKTKHNHFIILYVKPVRRGCKEHRLRHHFTKTFLNLAKAKRISMTRSWDVENKSANCQLMSTVNYTDSIAIVTELAYVAALPAEDMQALNIEANFF